MNGMEKYTVGGWWKRWLSFVAGIVILMAGSSCNKDFPNTLQKEFKNDTLGVTPKKAKVLYLILDGVRGKALKALEAPNLTQIYKKSIYAFDGLSDYDGTGITNAGAWANMLTGVTRSKHGVVTEDFAGNKFNQYPTLFSRIKQESKGKTRTVAISASTTFSVNLAADATEIKTLEGNDLGVKDGVINELKNPDATVVVGQFHSAEAAGQQSGYSDMTPSYANAIFKLDTYVGEIVNALSQRKTFADENWLVVIASNKGGMMPPEPGSTDKTIYADASRNSFVVFYNPRYTTSFIPKPDSDKIPFTGIGPRLAGSDAAAGNATMGNDGGLYNIGANGDYTFELKVKINSGASNYPTIVGKRQSFTSGVVGWVFFLEGDVWQLNLGRVGGGNTQRNGGKIRDGLWHTLTAKFYKDGSSRRAKIFTDGVLQGAPLDITAFGNQDSPAPLTLGYTAGSGGTIDVLYSDVQMYNVAIPDEVITAYARKTTVEPSHPYYNNLIGYWPLNEGTGTLMKNKAPLGQGKDFSMKGNAVWSNFNDFSPFIDAPISNAFFQIVPNGVDIPYQIYQWMGIPTPASLGLEGKLWKTTFNDVKLPY
ncbi:DUF4983 domain-containing protein [Pedobacter caeni]|uniref:Concanavalin A-like lectin/glucanases superfamily protein n=1 Tax=Pedobacter caeni TaxID=288992 RepID=A0A1M5P8R1_9SPHI|nr:LamG-like jellyroll fold domain-containing protein [Pedobacter caeni]SHG98194.1 Concanavalin A-like lectin/glucanases superfamily protein [Pedobacter caeni]